MKEGILLAGQAPIYVRWSGPGNKKILKGDAKLGYFGIVGSNELFSRTVFSDLVGAAGIAGTSLIGVDGWYKFIVDESKIIYIARAPLQSDVSWEAIYKRGLMYGSDDLGPDPVITKDYEHKNQFMFVNKKEWIADEQRIQNWFLKPRTLSGYDELVSDSNEASISDWEILRNIFSVAAGGTGEFDSEDNTDEKLGKHITLNRNALGDEVKIRGGANIDSETSDDISARSGTYLWRPVLELIRDGSKAFEPHYISWEVPEILSRNFEKWAETNFDSDLNELAKYNLQSWDHSYLDKKPAPKTTVGKKDVLGFSLKQWSLHTSDERGDVVTPNKLERAESNQRMELDDAVFNVKPDPYAVSNPRETGATQYKTTDLIPPMFMTGYIKDNWKILERESSIEKADALMASSHQQNLHADQVFDYGAAFVSGINWSADVLIPDDGFVIEEALGEVFARLPQMETQSPVLDYDLHVVQPSTIVADADRLILDEDFKLGWSIIGVSVHQAAVDPKLLGEASIGRPGVTATSDRFTSVYDGVVTNDQFVPQTPPWFHKAVMPKDESLSAKTVDTKVEDGVSYVTDRNWDFSSELVYENTLDTIHYGYTTFKPNVPAHYDRIVVEETKNVDFVLSVKKIDRSPKAVPIIKGVLMDPPDPDYFDYRLVKDVFAVSTNQEGVPKEVATDEYTVSSFRSGIHITANIPNYHSGYGLWQLPTPDEAVYFYLSDAISIWPQVTETSEYAKGPVVIEQFTECVLGYSSLYRGNVTEDGFGYKSNRDEGLVQSTPLTDGVTVGPSALDAHSGYIDDYSSLSREGDLTEDAVARTSTSVSLQGLSDTDEFVLGPAYKRVGGSATRGMKLSAAKYVPIDRSSDEVVSWSAREHEGMGFAYSNVKSDVSHLSNVRIRRLPLNISDADYLLEMNNFALTHTSAFTKYQWSIVTDTLASQREVSDVSSLSPVRGVALEVNTNAVTKAVKAGSRAKLQGLVASANVDTLVTGSYTVAPTVYDTVNVRSSTALSAVTAKSNRGIGDDLVDFEVVDVVVSLRNVRASRHRPLLPVIATGVRKGVTASSYWTLGDHSTEGDNIDTVVAMQRLQVARTSRGLPALTITTI